MLSVEGHATDNRCHTRSEAWVSRCGAHLARDRETLAGLLDPSARCCRCGERCSCQQLGEEEERQRSGGLRCDGKGFSGGRRRLQVMR
jgi:hypothetical protein